MTMDLEHGTTRQWIIGHDGVKRWTDDGEIAETEPVCAAGVEPCACAVATLRYAVKCEQDAKRYQYLRSRNLDTIHNGGVFAGMTPNNVIINGNDLDVIIDAAIEENPVSGLSGSGMTTHTALHIERKTAMSDWEVVAYPRNDIDEAKKMLSVMREDEAQKRYGKPLRLVRVTREYLDD